MRKHCFVPLVNISPLFSGLALHVWFKAEVEIVMLLFQKAELFLGKKPPFLDCTTALLIVGKIMQTSGDHSNLLASNIYCRFCYVQFGVCTDTKTKEKNQLWVCSIVIRSHGSTPCDICSFFFLYVIKREQSLSCFICNIKGHLITNYVPQKYNYIQILIKYNEFQFNCREITPLVVGCVIKIVAEDFCYLWKLITSFTF